MELKNKIIDSWGRVIQKPESLFEKLYNDEPIDNLLAQDCPETRQYNNFAKLFDIGLRQLETPKDPEINPEEFHKILQNNWLIPEEYKKIDIEKFLLNQCQTEIEKERIVTELKMFSERDMIDLLKFLIYLVNVMRKNKVVFGVGRGSSVSSYVLFKIGIHKIDSLKYHLDINEFLR